MIYLVDVDHTIARPLEGRTFPDPHTITTDFEIINPHILESQDFFVGITNQAGIEMGHCSLDDIMQRMYHIIQACPESLKAIFIVPDFAGSRAVMISRTFNPFTIHADKNEDFRKPSPHLAYYIRDYYNDDLGGMWGDQDSDREFAVNIGVPFYDV